LSQTLKTEEVFSIFTHHSRNLSTPLFIVDPQSKKKAKTMSDQQQQDAGSEDFSGLTGFFFYVFIVHPITAWILRPGRFERKKSIMYAIAFLAGLAAIKTGKCDFYIY
jgi:hypothetical protein